MVDIYPVLLECAFDLEVLYHEESKKKIQTEADTFSKTQSCYIKTNNGSVKIAINFTAVGLPSDNFKGLYTAKFINNLVDFSDEDVQNLILDQLDIEKSLQHDDSENIHYVCESF